MYTSPCIHNTDKEVPYFKFKAYIVHVHIIQTAMAMSKELLDKQGKFEKHDTDLTLCGICEAPIEEDSKALPCLHTFCLGCIQEWAKGKTDKIQCPLCKEDFVIPSEGVSGFRSNFFVTNLKKMQAMREEVAGSKITCTCCENAGNAVARCLECKGYLCDSGVQGHQTFKALQGHRVCSFDDIRTGKVDLHKLYVQECCSKHFGQVLWFFCESCGILICRDCTVIDHPASTHTLVNVEEVSGEQSKQMDKLASQCRKVAEQVDDAIKIADGVEITLREALQKANTDVDNVTLEIIAQLKVKQQKCKDEIAQAGDDCREKILVEKDKLQSQRSQLRRAIEMTDTVTRTGSPYDLAGIYTTLTDTMHKLSDIEPVTVSAELAEVKFVPNNDFQTLPEFGTLTTSAPITTSKTQSGLDLQGEWEMTGQLCIQGKLSNAVGIALYPSGDMAVASTDGRVGVFDQNGTFKHDIDVKGSVPNSGTSQPRSVVVTSVNGNWHIYVTDMTPVVKVFDMKSNLYINKFETISPDSSHSKQSSLCGLAIGCEDQIIVGDFKNPYISIHKLCGTHLSSFKVSITPFFLASASNDNTIIVSQYSPACVQIMDYTGQVLHTLDRPTGVDMAWQPTGICFNNGDGEFLISSQAKSTPNMKAGVHRYTTQGDYLGCITTQVDNPIGVVITRDGKILVLEWTSVKVLTKK